MGALVPNRRRSQAEWSTLVAAWQRSGEPVESFASRAGVTAKALAWWRWRLGEEAPGFVEVEVATVPQSFVVELARVGHRVEVPEGFDARELRRLVAALC